MSQLGYLNLCFLLQRIYWKDDLVCRKMMIIACSLCLESLIQMKFSRLSQSLKQEGLEKESMIPDSF